MINYFYPTSVIAEVAGPDARRYLNSRLSNNIKDLAINETCSAAALSPTGKTELLLDVTCRDKDIFLITCNLRNFEEFKGKLDRFKVADNFQTLPLCHLQLTHIWQQAEPEQTNTSLKDFLNSQSFIIHKTSQRLGYAGYDLIADGKSIAPALSQLNANQFSTAEAKLTRLKNKIPSFTEEINEQFIFIEAGQWQMVAENAGCYCGQEVIEKVRSRGQLPYQLKAFCCQGAITGMNKIVHFESEPVGEIISNCLDENNQTSYGFIRLKTKVTQEQALDHQGLKLLLSDCNLG